MNLTSRNFLLALSVVFFALNLGCSSERKMKSKVGEVAQAEFEKSLDKTLSSLFGKNHPDDSKQMRDYVMSQTKIEVVDVKKDDSGPAIATIKVQSVDFEALGGAILLIGLADGLAKEKDRKPSSIVDRIALMEKQAGKKLGQKTEEYRYEVAETTDGAIALQQIKPKSK